MKIFLACFVCFFVGLSIFFFSPEIIEIGYARDMGCYKNYFFVYCKTADGYDIVNDADPKKTSFLPNSNYLSDQNTIYRTDGTKLANFAYDPVSVEIFTWGQRIQRKTDLSSELFVSDGSTLVSVAKKNQMNLMDRFHLIGKNIKFQESLGPLLYDDINATMYIFSGAIHSAIGMNFQPGTIIRQVESSLSHYFLANNTLYYLDTKVVDIDDMTKLTHLTGSRHFLMDDDSLWFHGQKIGQADQSLVVLPKATFRSMVAYSDAMIYAYGKAYDREGRTEQEIIAFAQTLSFETK